jgi:6-pyruvoyltetrahydropterin/6-carboxytetrahydropterin synthase
MYTVGIKDEFITQHFLIGGDFGKENKPHSHRYEVEVTLKANNLDRHEFVFDIEKLSGAARLQCAYFQDSMLNDIPEFMNKNTSVEALASAFHSRLQKELEVPLKGLKVLIWEHEKAWASFEN